MGVRGQSKASRAPSTKPRVEVRGHPDFAAYRKTLKASQDLQDKYLDRLVDNAIDLLGDRPAVGNAVQRTLWPKKYRKLTIPCLFRYDLDANHRMTYSIIKTGNEPLFVWIIEVMDHKQYNKLFGYN